ncbi:hypothetical protein M413DRAFT_445341 [Hebeloma cylindrosporum]|uniref:Uncharacterized protein n=1 Tax=Hebeloma cylindrosporum TaxID=76867 RepID=A0A0C3BXJ1_HEBCY|nr:hypothetical protein M413DRAFT_445341 [Hebeloma cylindrosporum h7]
MLALFGEGRSRFLHVNLRLVQGPSVRRTLGVSIGLFGSYLAVVVWIKKQHT